ncbi:ribonuclease BN family membrane protein [Streptomyces azureus]|uniref:Ribonuclease BN family membrane protein n=1 Tax=Streptomyces azureus TaxID=146537 RepID=A0A0K8PDH8_STRAJ|nr:ribonuclease BN family membrane protein [Streptomyces azureus]
MLIHGRNRVISVHRGYPGGMARLPKLGHKDHEAGDGHRPDAAPGRTEQSTPNATGGAEENFGPGPDVERRAPDALSELPRRSWGAVLKGSLREFKDDELTDRAAALTYYGVLSLFPALLVLVSLLGLVGKSATDSVLDNLQ